MAVIDTIEKWRLAISYLKKTNHFGDIITDVEIGTGVAECYVLESSTLTNITPDNTTLETALDNANIDISDQQQQASDDSTAYTDLLNAADAGITQITNDIASLASASSLAEAKPIIDNLLDRQLKIIKAIRGLVRNKV